MGLNLGDPGLYHLPYERETISDRRFTVSLTFAVSRILQPELHPFGGVKKEAILAGV